MAPPSPRRSSRARPSNSLSQHSSSASSITSARIERSTRSANRSTPSASLSSESPEDPDDSQLLRRSRRALDNDRDKIQRRESTDMANGGDDIQEDDEAVRCICGFDDYPGPPPLDDATKQTREAQDSIIFSALDVSEDVSGFFVQCDICKVWQHGACVGIVSEESSPDEYFCEKCRKDFHKIHKASNGQRYSTYLPLQRTSRTSRSTSIAKEGSRSSDGNAKSDRQSSINQASKRRSTMNSREAAYDEEEQLRRAIEASKELVSQDEGGPPRRTKRGRSDSEENSTSVKRQRTGSRSPTPPADQDKSEHQDDSEDEALTRNGSRKARPSRSQKEKSEREERERQRQEAANKRKGRADRRRGEDPTPTTTVEKEPAAQADVDSDPSDEVPLATTRTTSDKPPEIRPTIEPPPPVQPAPDTPPPANVPPSSAQKKGARSTHKKTKGRNQYTKDRDAESERSPVRSMSRDTPRNEDTNGNTGTKGERSSSARGAKGVVHNKVTINELKRRSGAFLDFIAKTQLELASEDIAEDKTRGEPSPQINGTGNGLPQIQVNGDTGSGSGSRSEAKKAEERGCSPSSQKSARAFKELNCVEMMDLLTRDLVKWQNRYST